MKKLFILVLSLVVVPFAFSNSGHEKVKESRKLKVEGKNKKVKADTLPDVQTEDNKSQPMKKSEQKNKQEIIKREVPGQKDEKQSSSSDRERRVNQQNRQNSSSSRITNRNNGAPRNQSGGGR